MPTRKTFFWLAGTVLLYLIALNVGSGWLYVVTALLIAYPVISIPLSQINARNLRFSQKAPASASQGDTLPATLTIGNPSRLPRFFIRLDCSLAGSRRSVLVPELRGGRSRSIELELEGVVRGVYSSAEIRLTSTAPAGLARRRVKAACDCPLVVYPRLFKLSQDWGSGMRHSGYMVSSSLPTRSTASDYLGVRDYRPEDSPRSIHWRTSARRNNLAVVEYARQAAMAPVFIVDPFAGAVAGSGEDSTFETAVSIAASLVEREVHHNRRFGIGASPADAAEHGFSLAEESAMLWLAGVEPSVDTPLDLDGTLLTWPEVTPVVILASHAAYGELDGTRLLAGWPHSVVVMLDGRGFTPDGESGRRGRSFAREDRSSRSGPERPAGRQHPSRFMDSGAIAGLADRIEENGGRFVLISSPDEVNRCLESL